MIGYWIGSENPLFYYSKEDQGLEEYRKLELRRL